ncbi:MAG: efflux RND transporter permease subunit [Gloeomargaritaceae cyanobacterium C42_A2020_066]|nr:efflux RND transporter permease subunit [Gloeomargaritaceae cyanobacterium C42_A2020_066]
MFVDFFIRRPVFATVCALIIIVAGLASIPTLPVDQFPNISPPQVTVSATFDGANAEVVEETVTTVLERQINGVEGMRYLTSTSGNDGGSSITVTFELERNKDLAAVDIQNRVTPVESQLPDLVQRTGVSVEKLSNNILMGIGLFAEQDRYDSTFLSNYADLYLVDTLKRVKGVSDVRIFGERRFAMRLWLDPTNLAKRGLTPQDVVAAVEAQNLQVGAGQLGQPPAPTGQSFQLSLRAVGRLRTAEEFDDLVIRTQPDGSLIKLKDVGRAELGAENYSSFLRFRGQEAVGLGIYPLPDSNALEVARGVKAEMVRLATSFPPGMTYRVAYDTTNYIEESMREVVQTLIMAIVLVVLVIFIFLQDRRTTLIPAVTIPIALIGTFAFIKAFNFSINSLTLFGLTLASGLVVDDAIVIVENVTRFRQTEGRDLSPQDCTALSMRQITGAVIATSLVLMAVFVPVTVFPGTTGRLYRQFALTIAFSITLSTFTALTLTPALSALLLQHQAADGEWTPRNPAGRLIYGFFHSFNRAQDVLRERYAATLEWLVRHRTPVIIGFVASLGLTVAAFRVVPTAFLPDEDQGYFITIVQAPEGVSLEYTSDVMRQVEALFLKQPEVEATFAVGGFAFSGTAPNSGVVFTTFKPWSERRDHQKSAQAVIERVRFPLLGIPGALVIPFNPPAIQGLSSFGGFQFQLQDRGNNSIEDLAAVAGELIQQGNQGQAPGVTGLFTTFQANTPQLEIQVDRDRAAALGVSVQDIFNSLLIYLGSRYVNDFTLERRNYRVYVQADQNFRAEPGDLNLLYVRAASGEMIPLSRLVTVTRTTGPQFISHYNLLRSIEINGSTAPGFSSGQALAAMESLAQRVLPSSMGYEWSGASREEITAGRQAPLIFVLGLVFVFLVLAAQYESYIDPLIIMLSVPLAVLGALAFQMARGLPNDIYCQIGLVMLIALASKNAILIVEFANQLRAEGLPLVKAAVEASVLRLRPILMTAISTLVGIWPLVIAVGAGAASRQSLGTAVFGGILVSTVLSLFVVPVLYIVVGLLVAKVRRPAGQPVAGH